MATSLAKTSSHFIAAMLLTALLAATLLLPSTNAATAYPNCPLTGKPPTKPAVPPTRCVGASRMSCCPDACADLNFAVQALAVNVTAAVLPGVGHIAVGSSLLGDVSRYSEDMLQLMIVPLIAQQIPGFNATFSVQDTACYGGPTVIPVIPLSCDPLTIPATCPPGAVNMTAAKGVSGRPLDPAICAGFPYSNATRPFPESFDVFPYPRSCSCARLSCPCPFSAYLLPANTHYRPSPPPPKAAGPSGASLAAAVLPLLAAVLMAGPRARTCSPHLPTLPTPTMLAAPRLSQSPPVASLLVHVAPMATSAVGSNSLLPSRQSAMPARHRPRPLCVAHALCCAALLLRVVFPPVRSPEPEGRGGADERSREGDYAGLPVVHHAVK
ncbi:unnamed protein product [Closterium sp. Naga37s-1]|nr:unnamed protein product [Closterium sp. Naga37s-1]